MPANKRYFLSIETLRRSVIDMQYGPYVSNNKENNLYIENSDERSQRTTSLAIHSENAL